VRRLRFLRILIPILLIPLGWLLYQSWNPRDSAHGRPQQRNGEDQPQADVVNFIEWEAGRRTVDGKVDHFEQLEDGGLHLEGVHELEIHREDRGPLVVSAVRGDRSGGTGERLWTFEGQVVLREPEEGLELVLPRLEVDEVRGEARSAGNIRFKAPGVDGRAQALVYGLRGQPGSLSEPVLDDEHGGQLFADDAALLDGLDDVELLGNVRVLQGGERLDAGRLRLWRGGDGRMRRALARDGVWGSWPLVTGGPAHLRSAELEARWDDASELESLRLDGDALIRRGVDSLSATTIEATAGGPPGAGWKVVATDHVLLQGIFGGAPGSLRAERLEAQLDGNLVVKRADANGRVSFEGSDTRAEADRASFVADIKGGEIRLFSDDRRKARLSHGRTRVAADLIVTDARGQRLVAERRVEANLLPGTTAAAAASMRLFAPDEAIHFVAKRLESEQSGSKLKFIGSVRAWQGERNLAAEEILVDQTTHSLEARTRVASRIPRQTETAAVSENDYVQISAERLTYDDAAGLAAYSGNVRLVLAEGWLEAERVEIEMGQAGGGRIQSVQAFDGVRLEFTRTNDRDLADPISGTADRVVYDPTSAVVRLFGDRAPASLRDTGEGGGTTTGRVLAYRLDLGTLGVDSGDQGSGNIRTTGG